MMMLLLLLGAPALQDCPSTGVAATPEKARSQSTAAASIDLAIGFSTKVLGARVEGGSDAEFQEESVSTTFSLVPQVEWELVDFVQLAVRLGFHSVEDPFSVSEEDRSIVEPGAGLRISLPVWKRVSINGALSLGLALWSADGENSLVGWSRHTSLGLSYALNDVLTIRFAGGYSEATALPVDDLTSNTVQSTQALRFTWFPISLGVQVGGRR